MKDFFHIIVAGAIGALAAYFNVLLIPLIVFAMQRANLVLNE